MNIECPQTALDELNSAFRFNDAVLRKLIIARPGPDTEQSPLAKTRDEHESRQDDDDDLEYSNDNRAPSSAAAAAAVAATGLAAGAVASDEEE